MKTLKDFVQPTARPLPVILLVDVSGSMSVNGKIDVLNTAVGEMVTEFGQMQEGPAEIHVAVITFGGGGAKLHQPIQPAASLVWQPAKAEGHTPMAAAFTMAQAVIEDRSQIPSRAYRPTMVLVSDGQPTNERGRASDNWQPALQALLASERASKATRLAMAIGDDADLNVLTAFLGASGGKVFRAQEARQIQQFFRWVTMTVTSRSRSATPDAIQLFPMPDPTDVDF